MLGLGFGMKAKSFYLCLGVKCFDFEPKPKHLLHNVIFIYNTLIYKFSAQDYKPLYDFFYIPTNEIRWDADISRNILV